MTAERSESEHEADRLFGWYWAYLRRLSRRFDATVVSGQWLAAKLSRFGLSRPEAVPFGVDKSLFSPKRRRDDVRRQLLANCGIDDDDAALLVNISRFHPEKRLGTILTAFEQARQQRPMGLVIYGDGPLRRWVRRRARQIPGVYLAGYTRGREELANALASADAMFHGSAAETYGIVVAEAICSGLPIVVPDVGGAADLAGTSYSEVYPAGEVRAAVRALLLLLERPRKELLQGCAKAAEQKVWTMDEHFVRLFALYERLVEERRSETQRR